LNKSIAVTHNDNLRHGKCCDVTFEIGGVFAPVDEED